MLFDARDVPRQRPENDLDERDGYGDADADEGGKQRQPEPDRRHEVEVHRSSCRSGLAGVRQPGPTRTCGPGRSHQPSGGSGRVTHRSFIRVREEVSPRASNSTNSDSVGKLAIARSRPHPVPMSELTPSFLPC